MILEKKAIEEGFTPVYSKTNGFIRLLYFVFSTFWLAILLNGLPILAAIPTTILLCKGVIKILNKNIIDMQKIAPVAVYKRDRRYRDGERLVGYTNQKQTIKVQSSKEEAENKSELGTGYIVMALISYAIGIIYSIS